MRKRGGTPSEMKRINKCRILKTLRRKQPVSRVEISEETSISRTTVSQLIDELMAEGLVREAGTGTSHAQGGRRPVFLSIHEDAAFLVGVDIGGSTITFVLCNLFGRVLRKKTVSTPATDGLDFLFRETACFLREAPVSEKRLIGLGVGAPGVTRFPEGVVLSAPSLGWRDLPLRERMESRFGLPVYVENDVNAAALGECWLGAGRGKDHMMMITVGTGIGCGLILNGEVYRGYRWASGEIGLMITHPEGVEAWDDPVFPGYGYLESKAGGPAISRRWREAGGEGSWGAKEVFEAWRKGDPLAGSLIREANIHLAAGVANGVVLFDPEVVILGGGLMKSGDLFLPLIRRAVDRVTPSRPEIRLSLLGADAGALGAAALVLREHEGFCQGLF